MMFVSFSTWRPCLGQPGALVVVNLAPLSWSTWRLLLGALVWSTWRPCLGQPGALVLVNLGALDF